MVVAITSSVAIRAIPADDLRHAAKTLLRLATALPRSCIQDITTLTLARRILAGELLIREEGEDA